MTQIDWKRMAARVEEVIAADRVDAVRERMRPEFSKDPTARRVQEVLVNHPEFLNHAAEMGQLSDLDKQMTAGYSEIRGHGPLLDRPLPITPKTVAHDVMARMMGSSLGIIDEILLANKETHSQEHAIESMCDVVHDIVAGRRPVVFLTPGQQEALWYTKVADDTMPTGSIWPHGPVVIFPTPIEFRAILVRGIVMRPGESGDTDLLIDWHSRLNDDEMLLLRCWLPRVRMHSGETINDPELARFRDFIVSVWTAMEMFGIVEEPVVAQHVPRHERRRLERAVKKGKAPPASNVSVRYLRDPRKKIAAKRVTDSTGKHLKPHWRRGHIRWVRTGSMALPKDERPRVRHLIPPIVVNAHLGDPKGVVVYRTREELP